MDPIQVWENHAGPIPYNTKKYSLIYRYVAYRDPEAVARYGYGNTKEEAMEEFIRQEAEEHCSNCTECTCKDDCILVEPNYSAYIKTQMVVNMEEDDTSHREWREINGPKPY